jgi:hypothetical protein
MLPTLDEGDKQEDDPVRHLITSAPPSIRRDAEQFAAQADHPVTHDARGRVRPVIVCGAGPATAAFNGACEEDGGG